LSIDDKIAALKRRTELATANKYRAQAAREAAQASEAEAMQALHEKFGLDSLADARAKLAELEASIASKVAEATELLDTHNL
jgi:hypothetical protein